MSDANGSVGSSCELVFVVDVQACEDRLAGPCAAIEKVHGAW
ncbi:MAG TPA: hypothetical protein VGD71_23695 [Kribbella sp.]|jgi:hypothetical protein